MPPSPPKTSANFDIIRCVATFLVMVQHAAAPVTNHFLQFAGKNWWWAHVYDTISRPCVPIFLFLSGALLLKKQESYSDFFNRRVKRILLPMFFWAIIYFWWRYFYHKEPMDADKIVRGLLDTRSIYPHLWYLDLVIGLYVVTPILRKILPALSQQDFYYLFAFWVTFMVINPMISATFLYWKGFQVSLISQYSCYFVGGYYYERFGIGENERKIGWAALFSGTLTTFLGMGIAATQAQQYEWFWYGYHSPSVFAQSFGSYLLLYYYGKRWILSEKTAKILQYISGLTFGMYLFHPLLIDLLSGNALFVHPFSPSLYPTWWSVPVFAGLIFVISAAIIGLARVWKAVEAIT
jgi:surface polysaccharide O-acyltransferase-like enzyme